MAVGDLCDHRSMLQVNVYMLSVYRTAAGTKDVCMYVCFKVFTDIRISFCFSVKLVICSSFVKIPICVKLDEKVKEPSSVCRNVFVVIVVSWKMSNKIYFGKSWKIHSKSAPTEESKI